MFRCGTCGADHDRVGQRKCRLCHAAYMRSHRTKFSDLTWEQKQKHNCRSYTRMLLKRGVIQQQPCEDCGSPHSQVHHDDYNNPVEVRWKCRACHLAHHKTSTTKPSVVPHDWKRPDIDALNPGQEKWRGMNVPLGTSPTEPT